MDDLLQQVVKSAWEDLADGSRQPNHAYHTLTVAHTALAGINAYTVVLRDVDVAAHQVIFYTDYRSEKVGELQHDNHITAVFYDRQEQCQLVIKGRAVIDAYNEIALRYWKQGGFKGRTSYLAAQPPSTPVEQAGDGLEYLKGKTFTEDDLAGYENFAVVTLQVTALEYLKLSRQEGNRRARFNLVENRWQGTWVIP